MVKVRYSDDYNPPFPILEIALSLPRAMETLGPFPAVVDSGADASLVPKNLLAQLGAESCAQASLRGPWGKRRLIYTFLIDIWIGDHVIPNIEVVGDNLSQDIILGRTLLNKMIILLDGPETTLYVLTRRPRHLAF